MLCQIPQQSLSCTRNVKFGKAKHTQSVGFTGFIKLWVFLPQDNKACFPLFIKESWPYGPGGWGGGCSPPSVRNHNKSGRKSCFSRAKNRAVKFSSVSADGFDREDQFNPPGWKKGKLRKVGKGKKKGRNGEKGKRRRVKWKDII